MTAPVDRLACAKARPLLAEEAVRVALRDAIAWRIGGGSAPNAEAFAAAAVACARQTLDAAGADTTERSRALHVVRDAAMRLYASALGRRLMTVPAARFIRFARTRSGPDAVVRDRKRRLHAIVLRLDVNALDAARTADAAATATPLAAADRLSAMTVHVFSLATGRRHSFERDVIAAPARMRVA